MYRQLPNKLEFISFVNAIKYTHLNKNELQKKTVQKKMIINLNTKMYFYFKI